MNRRQKKKQIKMKNKKLIKKYPFLMPRSVWTGKVPAGYDYTYTEYDEIPKGWQIGFGEFLLEDLKKALIETKSLYSFYFMQIKEKFGALRMYPNGAEPEVWDILDKYGFISQYVCCQCGSPYTTIVNYYGWLLPLCKECVDKNNNIRKSKGYKILPYSEVADEEKPELPCSYTKTLFSNGKDEEITYDISDTVEKIKDKYNRRKAKWK